MLFVIKNLSEESIHAFNDTIQKYEDIKQNRCQQLEEIDRHKYRYIAMLNHEKGKRKREDYIIGACDTKLKDDSGYRKYKERERAYKEDIKSANQKILMNRAYITISELLLNEEHIKDVQLSTTKYWDYVTLSIKYIKDGRNRIFSRNLPVTFENIDKILLDAKTMELFVPFKFTSEYPKTEELKWSVDFKEENIVATMTDLKHKLIEEGLRITYLDGKSLTYVDGRHRNKPNTFGVYADEEGYKYFINDERKDSPIKSALYTSEEEACTELYHTAVMLRKTYFRDVYKVVKRYLSKEPNMHERNLEYECECFMKHVDIATEFAKTISSNEWAKTPIKIHGFTAQELNDNYPLNLKESYRYMILLRESYNETLAMLNYISRSAAKT